MATVDRRKPRKPDPRVFSYPYALFILAIFAGAVSLSFGWVKPAQIPGWMLRPGMLVSGAANGMAIVCEVLGEGPAGVIDGTCGEVPATGLGPADRCWADRSDAWCASQSLLDAAVFWSGLFLLIGLVQGLRHDPKTEKPSDGPWSKLVSEAIYLGIGGYGAISALRTDGLVQTADGQRCWQSPAMCFHDLSLKLPLSVLSATAGLLAVFHLGLEIHRWRTRLSVQNPSYRA